MGVLGAPGVNEYVVEINDPVWAARIEGFGHRSHDRTRGVSEAKRGNYPFVEAICQRKPLFSGS
jgi:hypothetical protein